MKEINLFINEKLKINKDSHDKDYEKTYNIYLYSSIDNDKNYLERLLTKTKINKDNIECDLSEKNGYKYTYQITLYNKKDVLSLFIYILDSYSEETAYLIHDFNLLDKCLNRGIQDYNKNWKNFLHSNFTDDEIKDRILQYTKDNYIY